METGNINQKTNLDQAVDALVACAAERDRTAEGHSVRVTRYSLVIGKAMNLDEQELLNLKYAAGLHDIGKVSVSRNILDKIGKLTDDELSTLKLHSTIAMKIVEKIDGLKQCAPIIKHHHERFDGKGYPDALEGAGIPLGSRIIALAEVFDILTSEVPWRDAMPDTEALEEIKQCSGTQFDPEVVEAFEFALTKGALEQ